MVSVTSITDDVDSIGFVALPVNRPLRAQPGPPRTRQLSVIAVINNIVTGLHNKRRTVQV